jgi:uncharacterized protein (TIGR02646 family)
MIHVDRTRVERPRVLSLDVDSPALRELTKAREYFTGNKRKRRSQRFAFQVYGHAEVTQALTKLFHGKCAYCESQYAATAPLDVEFFRPKSAVTEAPEHPGYWWLAMVWENLLPACVDCNRVRVQDGIKTGKANRFPLEDESVRAYEPGQEMHERPLLLDPCADHPEQHLVFEEASGAVVSDTKRGQATIALLGLNREHLRARRNDVARSVGHQIRLFNRLLSAVERGDTHYRQEVGELAESLIALTDEAQEYAALKRQLVGRAIDKLRMALGEKATAAEAAPTSQVSKARKQRAKKAFSSFQQAQASYSLEDEKGRDTYRGQRRMIEQIAIEDVKAIDSLQLDFTTTGRTPWLMLLGENGTGKSTVLHATSLVLLGAQAFARLVATRVVHPRDYVRYDRSYGSVSVKLSGFPKAHRLILHPDRVEFTSPTDETTVIHFDDTNARIEGTGWEPQMLLLGYGATKLLPRSVALPSDISGASFSRVDNLFDPFVPLLDAQTWLLGLDETRFEDMEEILKDLLALPSEVRFIRDDGQVLVELHKARVPLRQLSDGYQSVVAMTADVLEVALRLWPNLQEAEGIVLVDEVGAHLHPTWRMRIVTSLRKALPAMQFLATTHDPLCLRGLTGGEVAVMRRLEDSRVVAITDLPSPGDFRVDQLLTSDFFGLSSTIDPEVEAVFDEYYALLALREPNEEQLARIGSLRSQLKDRRHLGSTLRESLMYDAVDRLLAEHRRQPLVPLAELKQAAVDEIAKIWNAPTVSEKAQ